MKPEATLTTTTTTTTYHDLSVTSRSMFYRSRTLRKIIDLMRISRMLFAAKLLRRQGFDDITHEETVICRQLFAGHEVGYRTMKRKNICIE